MSFAIFQIEKSPFQAIIKKKFQKSKNSQFSNGVKTRFWSKNGHFSNFFFQAIQARKMTFAILQNEKSPFQAIKTRSSKVEKLTFFQRGKPMVLVQKWPFFHLFFFQTIQGGKKTFAIFQNEKTPFQAIETKTLKSRKIDVFPKG